LHRVAVTGVARSEVQVAFTTIIMIICTGGTGTGVTVVAIMTTATATTD
jgi:hypothetical protein